MQYRRWSSASSGSTISVSDQPGPASAVSSGCVSGPSAGVTAMAATAYRRQFPPAELAWISTRIPSVALRKLCRDSRLAIQSKRLLDLELVDLHGLSRQAKRFAAGGQRHLGKTRRRHDALPLHLVIGQPRHHLGSDICLPHMVAARRHLDVHPKQGVSIWQSLRERLFRDPISRMKPRRQGNIREPASVRVGGRDADCGELRMEEQGFVFNSLQRRGDDEVVGRMTLTEACH